MHPISVESTASMLVLGDLGVWIASNESLLSGIAAIIVVTGVIFTPIGAGLRWVLRTGGGTAEEESEVEHETTFAELTRQGPYETRFAVSDGLQIAYDVRDLLPHFNVPTVVVHFSGDLAVPIRLGRLLAEQIPNAEFVEMNAVDHADFARSPEAMDRIEDFCLRVGGAGGQECSAG